VVRVRLTCCAYLLINFLWIRSLVLMELVFAGWRHCRIYSSAFLRTTIRRYLLSVSYLGNQSFLYLAFRNIRERREVLVRYLRTVVLRTAGLYLLTSCGIKNSYESGIFCIFFDTTFWEIEDFIGAKSLRP